MISYWERKAYFDQPDFVIAGAGLVGMSAAYHLRTQYPSAKIIILDRSTFSDAASFKNAGFACFGSAGEILSDFQIFGEKTTLETVQMRLDGLAALHHFVGFENIGFQPCGSWELFRENEFEHFNKIVNRIPELNKKISSFSTTTTDVFSIDSAKIVTSGFQNIGYAIKNGLEGSLDVALLNRKLIAKMYASDIPILKNFPIISFQDTDNHVTIDCPDFSFTCHKLILATNGFSKNLLPHLDIEPARAQVLITEPIKNIKIEGTFHMNEGFDYFRNIDNRILLGGGRNVAKTAENTAEFGNTQAISKHLFNLLQENILPNTPFVVDSQWSGIMGVGKTKQPLIAKHSVNVSYGIRMGGMGVAIGTEVGKQLAELQAIL